MASTMTSSESTREGSALRGRWRVAVPMSFVIALVTVNVLAFRDAARFHDQSEVSSLTFGLPLGWLHQDQSAFDRPFPGTTNFSSPWEHPFSVEFVPLLLDTALVISLLLAAWLLVRAVRSR